MDFKIILSPRAIQDLQEIVRYISFDNPVRAESFGRELITKTRLLAAFPEMGRVVPEFGDQNTRELVHLSYRIVYRVLRKKQSIEVSRFWHGARGTPRL
ncbi:MAG TPA: type II toxin-antitoxin system RelE/ParE family toxin [Verrucomicrobiae bacterium]|jgi:plasmid stabilization system protein ParE|nr:type II toxin-antitoxin system RelE/ParE family toxin [Verrucomicrobiae bacterium]